MPALADAALDAREREVLDRFIVARERPYGDDLDAVWLNGHARGARAHDESDIDVLVVTRGERSDNALIATLWRLLEQLGNPADR